MPDTAWQTRKTADSRRTIMIMITGRARGIPSPRPCTTLDHHCMQLLVDLGQSDLGSLGSHVILGSHVFAIWIPTPCDAGPS